MTIEERLTNLENLVNSLIKRIDKEKHYSDANTAGIRQSVSDVTPYIESKPAYIGDTEVFFTMAPDPQSSLTIYPETYTGYERTERGLRVYFEPLEEVTIFTISII